MMVGLVIGIRQNGWDGAKKTSTAARAVAALRGIFHSPCLKAPSSKEIAAGAAYSGQ
jgi:hypothetical protein